MRQRRGIHFEPEEAIRIVASSSNDRRGNSIHSFRLWGILTKLLALSLPGWLCPRAPFDNFSSEEDRLGEGRERERERASNLLGIGWSGELEHPDTDFAFFHGRGCLPLSAGFASGRIAAAVRSRKVIPRSRRSFDILVGAA